MLNELAGKKCGGMKLANKYCYVRPGSFFGHDGKSLQPRIVTVQRFEHGRYGLPKTYGIALYSKTKDGYIPFEPFRRHRFATTAEAQKQLDEYARRNRLAHAEREY